MYTKKFYLLAQVFLDLQVDLSAQSIHTLLANPENLVHREGLGYLYIKYNR